MHEQWTDQLSDYLDGELTPGEQAAVEAHLRECAECTAVLNDLKRIVARARGVDARPPQADLWDGIAARIEGRASGHVTPFRARPQAKRFTFTVPQLAAASLLIAAMSGGVAWSVAQRAASTRQAAVTARVETAVPPSAPETPAAEFDAEPASFEAVSLADAQYDAAVVDLERALKEGRGRLDPATIATVEHNLETIDHAIQQAREALASDPANTYLSSHLIEARRRKLDLLRRAAALTTSESD